MPAGARAAGACRPDGLSPLRDQRLATRGDFSKVLSEGNSLNGDRIRVTHTRAGGGPARLGLAVPKRLTGTSVARNALRRRLSESFRARADRLAGCSVVVSLRAPCRDVASSRKAADEFGRMLEGIGKGPR